MRHFGLNPSTWYAINAKLPLNAGYWERLCAIIESTVGVIFMRWIAQRANSLGRWSAEHRDIVFALLVTATMRVWFAIWGALLIVMNGAPILPNPPTMYLGTARVPDAGWGLLLAPWQRWDAIWFLRIAQFGYAPNDAGPSFFPCFRY